MVVHTHIFIIISPYFVYSILFAFSVLSWRACSSCLIRDFHVVDSYVHHQCISHAM